MTRKSKLILYIISFILFIISFIGMIYYSYKTFYIEIEVESPEEYDHHFVLIGEEIDNAYWHLIEKGANQAAKEHRVFLEYLAPEKANNDQVLKIIDRMISVKVDGIITQGVEEEQFIDLVKKGSEREIPIITIDADIKNSERKAYVGSDNYYAGQIVGEAVMKQTVGEQFVGIIAGRLEAKNQQQRIAGFKDVIESTDRIHIVEITESNITQVGAAQATYSLLKRHPSLTALVGLSTLDGIGIVEGLQEIAPNKEMFITAFDTLPDTLSFIHEGEIDITIAQHPEAMGYESVETLIELQSNDMLNKVFFTEIKVINKENIDAYLNGVLR